MNIQYLDKLDMEEKMGDGDYSIDFNYTFIIGEDKEKDVYDPSRTIYCDMSGTVFDLESDNFAILIYNDHALYDGGYQGYYYDNDNNQRFVAIPDEVKTKLEKMTKEAIKKTESDKIKAEVTYYAEEPIVEDCGNGLLCMEQIGDFQGNKVYADFHAEVVEDYSILPNHNKGRYYLSPVYNLDNDKAYIIVPNDDFPDRKICFDMPHDILERCEKKAAEAAYRIKCDELHERLYKEYVKGWRVGFDKLEGDNAPMSYEQWLSSAYPDEGYFVCHVFPEEAKFLCEHDELINLDYFELYENSIKACFHLSATDFEDKEEKYTKDVEFIPCFDVNDAGLFHEDIDTLIARSVNPNLLKEMCEQEGIEAETFPEYFAKSEVSDYIGFEVDLTGKSPVVTAYMDFSTPKNVYSLGEIPLSEREQAFVLKACDEKFKQTAGMSFHDLSKKAREIERG